MPTITTQRNMSESEIIQIRISEISTCINFLTLLCTFATLIVATIAYRSIVKNKLQEEQLKSILSLIEYFRNKNFNTQFIDDQGVKLNFSSSSNLFALAYLDQRSVMVNLVNPKNFQDIWISIDDLQFFQKIANSECNPLLPKVIAQRLKRFWIDPPSVQAVAINLNSASNSISCVIIADDTQTQSNQIYNVSNFLNNQIQYQEASAFTSWTTFIETYQELMKEIRNWMKSHGISDLNI